MDTFVIVIVLALAATCGAMSIGITSMSSGGSIDREVSTKLMWVRVSLQALTVLLLVLALVLR